MKKQGLAAKKVADKISAEKGLAGADYFISVVAENPPALAGGMNATQNAKYFNVFFKMNDIYFC